tara:strand:- start:183 stop:404 length:222 start_codon:yes stop_codon:yes gene_type:complete
MKLKIVLDIELAAHSEVEPRGVFIYGMHKPPFISAKHIHAWIMDSNHVADAVHEAFEFYKNDYVTAEVSIIEK